MPIALLDDSMTDARAHIASQYTGEVKARGASVAETAKQNVRDTLVVGWGEVALGNPDP